MEVPINTNVPIEFHPDSLLPHEEVLGSESSYGDAREALSEVYTWFSSVEDANAAFRKTLADEQRKLRTYPVGMHKRLIHGNEEEVYEAARVGSEHALKRAGSHLARIRGHEQLLHKALDRATDYAERKTPEGIALGAEIRRYISGLKDNERTGFVQKAITYGDTQVVAAVLRAPAFLSGLNDEVVLPLRHLAQERYAPQQYAQRKALEQIISKVEAAVQRVPARLAELDRAIKASGPARRHANTALNALRANTVVAK